MLHAIISFPTRLCDCIWKIPNTMLSALCCYSWSGNIFKMWKSSVLFFHCPSFQEMCVISKHNCVSIATVIKRFNKWMAYQAVREQIQSTEAKTEHRFNTHCWCYSSFGKNFSYANVNCELWIVKKAFLDDFLFYIFSYFFLGENHLCAASHIISHFSIRNLEARTQWIFPYNIQHNRNNTNKHGTQYTLMMP